LGIIIKISSGNLATILAAATPSAFVGCETADPAGEVLGMLYS
jgi:hypothetical protein